MIRADTKIAMARAFFLACERDEEAAHAILARVVLQEKEFAAGSYRSAEPDPTPADPDRRPAS